MTRFPALALAAAFCSIPLAAALPVACAQPPASDPPAAAPKSAISTADDLLTALETADQGIKSLQAEVSYTKDFGLLQAGNTEKRTGNLFFRADYRPTSAAGEAVSPPRRVFAVDFDKAFINNSLRTEQRSFIFDGEWFVERDHKDHQVHRRRIVPPGQTADPLRIGAGPFPIPIGQKRSDILSRFKVELLPSGDGFADEAEGKKFADTYQLKLVPLPGTDEARDFDEIRLWYRKKDLLPRLARTVNTDGARAEVFLVNPETNTQIPDQTFDTSPPPAGTGWDVDTQDFRKPADKKP